MKVYGYICPPTSGNYVFWIASDESAELWLSTTSSSANKVKIAFNSSSTKSRQWNKTSSQKSATIPLSAGNKYYVEALYKEGSGTDNMAVAWSKPGENTSAPSEVIPGKYLSPNSNKIRSHRHSQLIFLLPILRQRRLSFHGRLQLTISA